MQKKILYIIISMTIGSFLWTIGRLVATETFKTIKQPAKEKAVEYINNY